MFVDREFYKGWDNFVTTLPLANRYSLGSIIEEEGYHKKEAVYENIKLTFIFQPHCYRIHVEITDLPDEQKDPAYFVYNNYQADGTKSFKEQEAEHRALCDKYSVEISLMDATDTEKIKECAQKSIDFIQKIEAEFLR